MRRWINEHLDNAMFPLIKLFSPGYRGRIPPYRPPSPCDITAVSRVPAPLKVDLQELIAWRGNRAHRFRFPSPVQSDCAENREVLGRLLVADPTSGWVIIIPGYGTGTFPQPGYSVFLALQARALLERGINVAIMEPPYHLSRRRAGCSSGEGFFSPDLHETQQAIYQAAADVVALLRWLTSSFGGPVGLWGTSMSGCVAGLAATQTDEIAGLVLMAPLDNPGDALAVLPSSWEIRRSLQQNGLHTDQLPKLLQSVSPSRYKPAIPREHILFVTPLWDRVVHASFQEAFWHAWGRPERIVVDSGHVHATTSRGLATAAAAFLARWVPEPAP